MVVDRDELVVNPPDVGVWSSSGQGEAGVPFTNIGSRSGWRRRASSSGPSQARTARMQASQVATPHSSLKAGFSFSS